MPTRRKIYMNDGNSDNLLPKFIFNSLKSHSTSLGDNNAFPIIGDVPFDYKIIKEAYSDVVDNAKRFGIFGKDVDELESILSKLVLECKKQEEPIRDFLVKECESMINSTFSIPKESLIINYTLQDEIAPSKPMRVNQEDMGSFKFEDAEDAEEFTKEVDKRRLVDSLIQGAASTLSKMMMDEYGNEGQVYQLKAKYDQINAINDYLLFAKKDNISEKNPMQGGYAEVHLGMGGNKTVIDVQGMIFPFLLRETVKGLFELFSSHGLPQDKKRAQAIIRRADFILAEPWDMRFGTALYSRVFSTIDDIEAIPYMFMNLVSLDTDMFNKFMKDVLSESRSGEDAINWLYSTSFEEMDNDSSLEKEVPSDDSRAVINDDRIVEEDEYDEYEEDEEEEHIGEFERYELLMDFGTEPYDLFTMTYDAYDSDDKIEIVDNDGKYNYLKYIYTKNSWSESKIYHKFLLDKWLDKASTFKDGFALVMLEGKWYLMDEEGTLWTPKNEKQIQEMLPNLLDEEFTIEELDRITLTEEDMHALDDEDGCDASELASSDVDDIFFEFEDFGGMLYATVMLGECRFSKNDGVSLMAEPKPRIGENMFQLHISLREDLRRRGIATKLYEAFIRKCGDIVSLYSNRVGTYARDNGKEMDLDSSIDKIFKHLGELPNVSIEKVFSSDGKELGISATFNTD